MRHPRLSGVETQEDRRACGLEKVKTDARKFEQWKIDKNFQSAQNKTQNEELISQLFTRAAHEQPGAKSTPILSFF